MLVSTERGACWPKRGLHWRHRTTRRGGGRRNRHRRGGRRRWSGARRGQAWLLGPGWRRRRPVDLSGGRARHIVAACARRWHALIQGVRANGAAEADPGGPYRAERRLGFT